MGQLIYQVESAILHKAVCDVGGSVKKGDEVMAVIAISLVFIDAVFSLHK